MDAWQIAGIVIVAIGVIIGGSAGIKAKVKKVKAKAAEGLKEMSEAFMASSLLALKGEEVLKKPDITVDDARACWLEMNNAGREWADVFQWAVGIYHDFHPG